MPTPIRLQSRDLDMLHSLGIARFLTVQALEWLHYPTWRTNWQKHMEDVKRSYYPAPNLYRRLEGLRGGGYVVSIKRTQERATVVFQRLADVYGLTEAGADLLISHRQVEAEGLSIEGTRPRSLQNFEHSVTIAQFYAALRSELEAAFAGRAQRLELARWQADHTLARDYDRIPCSFVRGGRVVREVLPVLPDATFSLVFGDRQRRYLVEVDRATRPLDSWREKAIAFKHYVSSAPLATRYGVNDFVLLVVAPTATRIERIAQEIAKADPEGLARYRYIETSKVHPLTIRASWWKSAKLGDERRVVAGKIVSYPQVGMEATALWA